MKDRTKDRAELLAAMDCVMHHIKDKADVSQWRNGAIPDDENPSWHILDGGDAELSERRKRYIELAQGISDNEMDCIIFSFASIVKVQCFYEQYTDGAFDCK